MTANSSARPLRSASGYDLRPLDLSRRAALIAALDDEAHRVLLEHGTEPPFCGVLLHSKEDGIYACRLCHLPLFRSGSKFESGTGWPSFTQPFDRDHLAYVSDLSHGMARTEIRCARCGGHLGHVFPDGPPPEGLRYCLNSAALDFHSAGSEPAPDADKS